MTVIDEIRDERQRQIEVEGFTPEHDDKRDDTTIAKAAGCYAFAATGYRKPAMASMWPWNWDCFKITTPRRDLIKAAALIVAEIERLDRIWIELPHGVARLTCKIPIDHTVVEVRLKDGTTCKAFSIVHGERSGFYPLDENDVPLESNIVNKVTAWRACQ